MKNDQKLKVIFLRGNQRGFALILTMVMLAILSILGVMVLNTTNTELSITSNYRMTSDAFIQAEQAIEVAKEKIINDFQTSVLLPDPVDEYSILLTGLHVPGLNVIDNYRGRNCRPALDSVGGSARGNVYVTGRGGGESTNYRVTVEAAARNRSAARLEAAFCDMRSNN